MRLWGGEWGAAGALGLGSAERPRGTGWRSLSAQKAWTAAEPLCAAGSQRVPSRTATDTLGLHRYPEAGGWVSSGQRPAYGRGQAEPWVAEERAGSSSPAPTVVFREPQEHGGTQQSIGHTHFQLAFCRIYGLSSQTGKWTSNKNPSIRALKLILGDAFVRKASSCPGLGDSNPLRCPQGSRRVSTLLRNQN